jgi:hypothetical protein
MASPDKNSKTPPQAPQVPKLSGGKAILQIALLLIGPAILMYVLSLILR